MHLTDTADIVYVNQVNQIRIIATRADRCVVNVLIDNMPDGYKLIRFGDLSGSGKSGLLLRNADGKLKLWAIDGSAITSKTDLPDID